LQIQWMHDRSIDIPAHLDYLWRMLTGVNELVI
jgi:translation elongation factor EF-Tu-like GTPase